MNKEEVIRNDPLTHETKEYQSLTDAARDVDGQVSHISECRNHKRKTHKGYEWW